MVRDDRLDFQAPADRSCWLRFMTILNGHDI